MVFCIWPEFTIYVREQLFILLQGMCINVLIVPIRVCVVPWARTSPTALGSLRGSMGTFMFMEMLYEAWICRLHCGRRIIDEQHIIHGHFFSSMCFLALLKWSLPFPYLCLWDRIVCFLVSSEEPILLPDRMILQSAPSRLQPGKESESFQQVQYIHSIYA